MSGRGESVTSPRRITAAMKQREVLILRLSGMPLHEIADRVGFKSAASAHKAIARAMLKTIQEPADDLRKMLVEQLNVLRQEAHKVRTSTHYLVSAGKIVVDGEGIAILDDAPVLRAIETELRVHERLAKLLGLDAPTKIAPTNPDGMEPYDPGLTASVLGRLLPEFATRGTEATSGGTDRET